MKKKHEISIVCNKSIIWMKNLQTTRVQPNQKKKTKVTNQNVKFAVYLPSSPSPKVIGCEMTHYYAMSVSNFPFLPLTPWRL